MTLDILIPVAEKGGVENVINETASFLIKQGVTVRVVQLVWEGTNWTVPGIPYFPLLNGRNGHDLEEFVNAYTTFLSDKGTPDIVLATAWPYASYIAKEASLRLSSDITVASWLHTLPSRYEMAGYGDFNALNYADIHFAISRAIKNEILMKSPRGPIIRINNPVNTDFIPTIKRSSSSGQKSLIFVGRLSKEKHPEIMIEAISKTNGDWNLHFYGSGDKDFEQSLLSLSNRLGTDNDVFFHGWQDKPWITIEKADALVLASEYEGFPLSAIEAGFAGITVISSAFTGVDEVIVPGENGYIFEKNNPGNLAEILMAISNNLLPYCPEKVCKSHVMSYEKSIALNDFYCKLAKLFSEKEKIISTKGTDKILYVQDKISIILPCFNVSKYLRECLDSIINQSLSKEFYEIICINDASTDNTLDILMEYEKKYPDLILVVNCEANSGLGAVRNLGTYSYASGNYIVYIDSDDKIDKHHLQDLYEDISICDSDFTIAGYYKFSGNIKKDIPCTEGFYNMADPHRKKDFILYNGVNNSAWSKIFSSNFITKNNLRFPEKIYMEDILFYQQAMMRASSISALSSCIYAYRINETSIMNESSKKYLRQFDIYNVQKMSLEELIKNELLNGYENEFALVYYVRAFVSLLPEATIESVDENRKEVLKTIKKETLEVFPDFFDNPYINADKSEYNTKLLEYFRNL